MTVIRYPFVRATSVLAPSLLFLLSATGVHAEISTHDFAVAIVSAPPITTDNEAGYQISGDCIYIEGHNAEVTVTYSYTDTDTEHADFRITPCGVNGDWSVVADITNFGSGLVDEEGILKNDVEIRAVFTDDNGANPDPAVVQVYRNIDSLRSASGLTIGLTENRIAVGEEFHASATCGAREIIMDASGLMTVKETNCARMVSTANPDATLAMTDALTGASGACEFETLTMNGAGDIHITVDPAATERCLDDKDADGILDLQDPEPGTGLNNNLCVDSQNLIDNVAMTDPQSGELLCEAKDSITIQGVKLQADSDVCYQAGQFVRFASPALASSTEPVFSVPSGASFSIAVNGGLCSGS